MTIISVTIVIFCIITIIIICYSGWLLFSYLFGTIIIIIIIIVCVSGCLLLRYLFGTIGFSESSSERFVARPFS